MTQSIWGVPQEQLSFPNLDRSVSTEICVVGAGIAGLTTAYLLSKEGYQVLLVTDGTIAGGESSHTTAQISTIHDDSWQEMLRIHGEKNAQLCHQAYCKALNFICSTLREERIDCDFEFVSSYLFATSKQHSEDWLEKELAAAIKVGMQDVNIQAVDSDNNFGCSRALVLGMQGQFHPLKYLTTLALRLHQSEGVSIYCNSRVTVVHEKNDFVVLELQNGETIRAKIAILATNVPTHHRLVPHLALAPYRSYVIAMAIKSNAMKRAQYWDNEDPYHYVRFLPREFQADAQTSVILVGGEDHRVGQSGVAERNFERLERWARQAMPDVQNVCAKWSGQIIETFDGMPLIGSSSSDNGKVFFITGDSGTGMTHATLGAIMIRDLILNHHEPWHQVFDSERSRTKSLARWLKENAKSAAQYSDWLTPGNVSSIDEIAPNSGAILRRGLKKLAIYRASDGTIHQLSAVCPHLGGIVRWNADEKSWDCPAHGSRFTAEGKVINGPACCDLSCLHKDHSDRNDQIYDNDSPDIQLEPVTGIDQPTAMHLRIS